ncbi:uncharacterized protein LOC113461104 [Phoenix dactylifera]|uniref:Uncharacterized protein LOC113461104 n=1 Tax=Phoenix dactylifera TaxID=42345 RepID=A0A8B8J022_PHODC|nr:uncharacterized protein LOC113461104 [Phoenix dactylifera]
MCFFVLFIFIRVKKQIYTVPYQHKRLSENFLVSTINDIVKHTKGKKRKITPYIDLNMWCFTTYTARCRPVLRTARFSFYEQMFLYADSQEECFDSIGQAPVIGAEGYWCYTRLFYDVNRKPIRKVPVGKGSWNLHDTKSMGSGDGEKWCKRKLRYGDNRVHTPKFMMTQYSLGEKDDQPNYAICQIFRIADTAAGFREAAGGSRPSGTSQRDLLQNDVVPSGIGRKKYRLVKVFNSISKIRHNMRAREKIQYYLK